MYGFSEDKSKFEINEPWIRMTNAVPAARTVAAGAERVITFGATKPGYRTLFAEVYSLACDEQGDGSDLTGKMIVSNCWAETYSDGTAAVKVRLINTASKSQTVHLGVEVFYIRQEIYG